MSPKGRDVRLHFSKESAGNLSRGNRSRRPRGPPSRADLLALTVPVRLVVSGASAVLAHVDVLGVVEIRKRRDQDCVDDLERTGSGAGKEAPNLKCSLSLSLRSLGSRSRRMAREMYCSSSA